MTDHVDDFAEEEPDAAKVIRLWLGSRLPGCIFASSLARKPDRLWILHDVDVDALDAYFDRAGGHHGIPVVVWPRIVSGDELIEKLATLRRMPRWRLSLASNGGTDGASAVRILWETAGGEMSEVLGFGPALTMPATRRAPYFGMSLWPSSRANSFKTKEGKTVSFADGAHGIADEEKYTMAWKESEQATKRVLSASDDSAKDLRQVTFRLPTEPIRSAFPDLFIEQ